ncbi:hypothetical protein GZH47_11090 [Paenibacillus rhizovicinus]|uniref:Uncharacterized protein n=1 Tax=Paenibacillus rhizovicinus TaxID=2704463 RepID=A0A6C0NYM4_9BACL|nr:hypothetical protein [Paenibacillus rhizovicinus]QHW31335.1 hypothetical protein GZH47_11090 [Paenibacillus rhizovicinus]
MNEKVRSYFRLKRKQKELEQELAELREEILAYCAENEATSMEVGNYTVKVVAHRRKEYDEAKLFEVLPDLELWKLLSSPDTAKISNLVKLNVLSDERLKDTYTVKEVSYLQVERK